MDLNNILRNKLLLQKNYNTQDIDTWPYFILEENIKIINDITEHEEKERKKQEDQQKSSMPNINPSSYMKNMNNITSKFKK